MARFHRQPTLDGHSRASTLELFYDLVFVFAITQVSHYLLENDLTWTGAGQATVVLMAVWWTWNYTTWATNELDTGSVAVRALIIGVMLATLMMSVAIPEAFGGRALLFAGSYVAIQVGRATFMTFVVGGRGSRERLRASRILIWFCASGVLWIAGALADGPARTALWLTALALDYGAPLANFWVPRMKRISSDVWEVATEHFSERFQLFVIIALGESIVLTGAVTSELDLDAATVAAFVIAFLGSAALWWIYFNRAALGMQQRLELAEHRVELARDAYTYLHVVIIAGVIVAAVADEIVIAHPSAPLETNQLVAVLAGPVIYLLSLAVVRWRVMGAFSLRRQVAAVAIIAVGLIAAAADAPALLVSGLILAVLVTLIAYEEWAFRHQPADGGPTGREIFEADHGLASESSQSR